VSALIVLLTILYNHDIICFEKELSCANKTPMHVTCLNDNTLFNVATVCY